MDYFSACFPVEIFSQITLMISYDELWMLFEYYSGATKRFDNEVFWKIMYQININPDTKSYVLDGYSVRDMYIGIMKIRNNHIKNKSHNVGMEEMASYGAKRYVLEFLDLGATQANMSAFELAIFSEDIPLMQRLMALQYYGCYIVDGARRALIKSHSNPESKLNFITTLIFNDYIKREIFNGTLKSASRLGYMDVVVRMLDLGATDFDGASKQSVIGGQTDIMKYLISKGVSIHDSLFNAACEHNQRESINALISLGVNNFQKGAVTAAQKGNLEIVEYLIQLSLSGLPIKYDDLMGPCLDGILDEGDEGIKQKIQLVVDMLIKNGVRNYDSEYIAAMERKRKRNSRSYYSCYYVHENNY